MGNGTSQYLFLTPCSSADTLRFAIKDEGDEQILETDVLEKNAWHHVAVTLSGNIGQLYLDGVPVTTGPIQINPSDFNPGINYLGKSQFSADSNFKGRLDEFRIYNYALSHAEIADLVYDGDNVPPVFIADSMDKPDAWLAVAYTDQSLAGSAFDAYGDTLTYSKLSGPDWLSVDANGTLSGTPGADDLGDNQWTVQVSDAHGGTDEMTLNITVDGDATPQLTSRYCFDDDAEGSP